LKVATARALGLEVPESYVGLGSSPFCSGPVHRDQGISKAGNSTARSMMIELAWTWLRSDARRCGNVADYGARAAAHRWLLELTMPRPRET